jgi:hypothetical protein
VTEDSALVEVINTLLGFVPEQYRPIAEALLALMSALSLLLAAVRPILARYAPRLSGSAPVVVVDRVLNFLAGNSKRLEVRAPVVKERLSMPPRSKP